MNKELNTKVKELIFDYLTQNNLVIARPINGKWHIITKKKMEEDKNSSVLEQMNNVFITNKSSIILLDDINHHRPNWIVNQSGSKLFKYIVSSVSNEEKKDVMNCYSFFVNFSSALSALEEIDKKLAKSFFENAVNLSIAESKRSPEEEMRLLNKAKDIYSPGEISEALLKYLSTHSHLYKDTADRKTYQFVLKDFIEKNILLNEQNIKKFNIYLPNISPLEYDKVMPKDLFIDNPEETISIIISQNKIHNFLPLQDILPFNRSTIYSNIIDTIIQCFNKAMNNNGIISCKQIYQELSEKNSRKNEEIELLFKVEKNITKEQLKNIITNIFIYFNEHNEEVYSTDSMEKFVKNFDKFILKLELSSNLVEKENIRKNYKL